LRTPLIDGHNNLPWQIWQSADRELLKLDLRKMKAGPVGAEFWSVVVPPSTPGPGALRTALEQFDIIDQIITRYPDTFEIVTSADDIDHIFKAGKIASLIAVEGSPAMGQSLGVLRMFHKLGARSMTPASSTCETKSNGEGLGPFGESVVKEMNWLGMMVDLTGASNQATLDALRVTKAPVIFSHGGGCAEIPEDTLKKVRDNGGIVMIPVTTGAMDEIERVRKNAGIDHIGIGSDTGDVSMLPSLTAELLRRNYSNDDVNKILGLNLLHVMREVEHVSDKLHGRE
jgi:membrane dipeptidase